jgi:hypothetical protein
MIVRIEIGKKTQRVVHLGDVLLDEALGAEAGAAIERTAAHAAHVAVNALVEREQQSVVVIA